MLCSILIITFLIILAYLAIVYNQLVSLKNRSDNAWAQIDVNLKLRNDLIPELERIAKDYSKYEKSTYKKITELRSKIGDEKSVSKKYEYGEEMNGLIKDFFIVAENYPLLKANKAFLKLGEELSTVESNIAFKRQFYNDVVYKFNTLIMSFPSMIAGKLFNFKTMESFGGV